jgi:DNA gyrase subunit B
MQSELIIVEGKSAALAISPWLNANQHVFAMQGKPLNVSNASKNTLLNNVQFNQLRQTLYGKNNPEEATQDIRFHHVILLMDPDADGAHSLALLLLYFKHCLPMLIEGQRLWVAKAPVGELVYAKQTVNAQNGLQQTTPAIMATEAEWLAYQQTEKATALKKYKGLASVPSPHLVARCLNPNTRQLHCITF